MFNNIKMTFERTSLAAVALGMAVFSFVAPTSAQAEQYNMCQWQDIPNGVLNRIQNRDDFPGILDQMFTFCPESALALTEAPTGSVSDGPDSRDSEGDRVNGEDRSRPSSPQSKPENEQEGERGCCSDSPGDDISDVFGGLAG